MIRVSACVCVMSCMLLSCQTERVTTSDGWPLPPEPQPAVQPPASLRADRMAFTVGMKADDSDNNGFPDLIRASVTLFGGEPPMALREDGAFTFTLYEQGRSSAADSTPIAQWRIEGEAARAALADALIGPCYQFVLSLLATPSGDRISSSRADMICRFEPADGSAPVTSIGVRTLQIGARLR